jgi:hypothetical protein
VRGQRYEQKRFSILNFNEEETQKQAKGTYILLSMNVQKFFNMETFLWSEDLKLDARPVVQKFLTMDTFSRVWRHN